MPTNLEFAASVDDWTRATKERMAAVFRESTKRVIAEMQKPVGSGGNMPVDTGFLRASLQATINTPGGSISYRPQGSAFAYDGSKVVLTLARAKIGDTVFAVYGANYAPHVEYGANGRAGYGFVRLAAQQWQGIVNRVVVEAKSRAG